MDNSREIISRKSDKDLAPGSKVVLGFSGGLDTSFCVKYLTVEKGYEVHSVVVNTGGFTEEELKQIEAHAYKLGVKTHTTVDAVKSYYDKIIRFLNEKMCGITNKKRRYLYSGATHHVTVERN